MASNPFKIFLDAAQAIPGFSSNKPYAQASYTELGTPLYQPTAYCGPPPPMQQCDPQTNPKNTAMISRFSKVRRWTKIARMCSYSFSALFSIFMESIMFYVTYKHYKTKDLTTYGRPEGPWAANTKVWPTYMLAAASIVTSLFSLVSLIALCCRAKRVGKVFGLIYTIAHISSWVAVSATYRIAKTGDDLWGWSCSDVAKEIQQQLGSDVLNFESLCTLQASFSPLMLLCNSA